MYMGSGLEGAQPSLVLRRPGESLHRFASAAFAASWGWMIVAAIVTLTRLGSTSLIAWESVRLAALVVVPGAIGIALAMFLESLARRRRRRR